MGQTATTTMKTGVISRLGPPALDWEYLDCRAQFDYIKIWHPKKESFPLLSGTTNWARLTHGHTGFYLTVQDPLLQDIQKIVEHFGDPKLASIQLAVDLKPKPTVADGTREILLLNTFCAVAGRFRPEDEALWGYGVRGGVSAVGQKPQPFHRRFPEPNEELVYGHRGGWMQSTAYLKRTNEGKPLDAAEQRMRMELTLRTGGLIKLGLYHLAQLCGLSYRQLFRKHFRIISQPRVRAESSKTSAELLKLEQRMWRGWNTAGVGKFGIAPLLPDDTITMSVNQISARARQQLPLSDYVLERDNMATEKFGTAFKQLQRRMTPKKTRAV